MSDGYMSKDDDRKLVKAAVITSLVIIGFILIGMIKYIVYLSDNRLMEVPNLVGENFEEAKAEWKKKGGFRPWNYSLSTICNIPR